MQYVLFASGKCQSNGFSVKMTENRLKVTTGLRDKRITATQTFE